MNILVIGLGYVGATTALAFAELGWKVSGIDTDKAKLESMQNGQLPFYEPGLDGLLLKHVQSGNVRFYTDAQQAIRDHQILFLCVGTPSGNDGSANLSYIQQAAEQIGEFMQEYKVIVVKSTVPVGTNRKVAGWIAGSQHSEKPFDVVSNPEFLREGSALHDALHPDRIIIGSQSERAASIVRQLYHTMSCPVLHTEPATAEMIKYASNAFLAAKISFMNELARLCDQCGVQVSDIAEGMGLDSRIGGSFLRAGIGYGGSCFPKDVKALLHTARQYGVRLTLLEKVVKINRNQYLYLMTRLSRKLHTLKGRKIAVLGLAFKPGTDDLREAPSLSVISYLLKHGAEVKVHDPVARVPDSVRTARLTQCLEAEEALQGADAAVICTEWPAYSALEWDRLRDVMRMPYLFDGRNMLDAAQMAAWGYDYQGVGVQPPN